MEHNKMFTFLLWLTAALVSISVDGSIASNLKAVPPPLQSSPPSLPPCPTPLPPNSPPLPLNPPPLPPNPSPPEPPSLPPPHAPPPSSPNAPCFPGLLTCKNTSISDPSTICCDNLKIVYEKDENCVCTVLESPNLSKELGLNATDISNLLVECKITDAPANICDSAPAPAPCTPNPPPPPLPPSEATVMTKQTWTTNFFSIIMFSGLFIL